MVSNVKSEKLAQELKDLEDRGDDELKERWRSLYGTELPQKIHRSLLIAAIAYPTEWRRWPWAHSSLRSAAI